MCCRALASGLLICLVTHSSLALEAPSETFSGTTFSEASLSEKALSETALSGTTLSGEDVLLPDASDERSALVVSFSREGGVQASEWHDQIKREPNWTGATYSVLVLEGAPRFVRALIRRSLRSSVPDDERGQFVIVTEASSGWRQLTGATDDSIAHILMIREGNRVCGVYSGEFGRAFLENLLAGCE